MLRARGSGQAATIKPRHELTERAYSVAILMFLSRKDGPEQTVFVWHSTSFFGNLEMVSIELYGAGMRFCLEKSDKCH